MFSFDLKKSVRLFFTGFAMGAADIVPGVSGGTVAFLMGIYEELIQSIKTMSGEFLKLILQRRIKEAFQVIPFAFLIPLALGLMTAVLTLSGLLTFLLSTYPEYVWALFFGLIVSSVVVVSKRVVTWNMHDVVALVLMAIAAYFIVGAVPVETPNTLPALFISGMIAICAMILPGVSGSFLLVVMGKYEQVLGAVTNRDFVTLFVFGMGTIVGLSVFARVLSWLFKRHHDLVIAMLTGFMIGSLRKVWPWKEVLMTRINSHGEVVPLVERNMLPAQFDLSVMICLVLFAVGLALVLFMDRFQVTKEQVQDIDDAEFEKTHKKAVSSQKLGKI